MGNLPDDVIIVGIKDLGVYMKAFEIASRTNNHTITLFARGGNISKAADLALWAKRCYDFGIRKMSLSEEMMPARESPDTDDKVPISRIAIILSKDGKFGGRNLKKFGLLALPLIVAILFDFDPIILSGSTLLYTIIKALKVISE